MVAKCRPIKYSVTYFCFSRGSSLFYQLLCLFQCKSDRSIYHEGLFSVVGPHRSNDTLGDSYHNRPKYQFYYRQYTYSPSLLPHLLHLQLPLPHHCQNKQESVCKTGLVPPMLLCHSHCDLGLYPIDPKINREHLLSITNVCMKFEKAGPNQILVFDWTRLYTTDGQTDRWTGAKQYTPSSLKGGEAFKKKKKRIYPSVFNP